MNRKITAEESEKLFQFCRQHFVYHYDLQIELVDHLASAIEEQWEINPAFTFEEGLFKSFRKFGITGFSKIKEQKRKELARRYNRKLMGYLLEFFGWPKVLLTLALTFAFYTLLKIVNNDMRVIVPYFGILMLFIIYYYYNIFPKRFKIDKIKGKNFLILETLQSAQFITLIAFQVPMQVPNFYNITHASSMQNNFAIFAISFFIVLFTLALFGQMFYLPQKIKEDFNQQFPEFAT
jgi:hypothetical protein